MKMRLAMWVRRKPAVSSWQCQALAQRSVRVGLREPPSLEKQHVSCQHPGALQGKAGHSRQGQGVTEGTCLHPLSLVRPGQD